MSFKRTLGWLVISLVVVAGISSLPSSGPSALGVAHAQVAGGGSETGTVTYTGSYSDTLRFYYTVGSDKGKVSETKSEQVSWTFTWTGPMSTLDDPSGNEVRWNSEKLSGSTSDIYSNPESASSNCSADHLTAPAGQMFDSVEPDPGAQIETTMGLVYYRASSCGLDLGCPGPAVSYKPTYCDPGVSWDPAAGFKNGSFSGGISIGSVAGGETRSGSARTEVTLSGLTCDSGGAASDLPGSASTGAAGSTAATAAAAGKLVVKAGPTARYIISEVTGLKYKFTAYTACGRTPFDFDWKLDTKRKPEYLRVTPAKKSDHVSKGSESQLPIQLQCKLPPRLKKDAEDWHVCWGVVRFTVDVTDGRNRTGSDSAYFVWHGECSSQSTKEKDREIIDRLGDEIWHELPTSLAKLATPDGIVKLLENEELGPWLLVHGIGELGADIGKKILDAKNAEAELKLPDC